jgi:6-phosphogluconolactonase (cycloisomerase 2 family)
MKLSRHHTFTAIALGLAAAGAASARSYDDDGLRSGMVFTSSNSASGNELLVYARGADGTLTLQTRTGTGGLGSGAGLGSQGAVTLSGDGRFVFVVNAGSDSVTTFELRPQALRLASVVASGGVHPISVTEQGGVVFVLNDGAAGNVVGFRNARGSLQPINGAEGGLSVAGGAGPAQVGLSDRGDTLVVSEKNTNKLTSYAVTGDGSLGSKVITASPGATPFGFAFNRRNNLVVTEAAGGAAGASTVTSYRIAPKDQGQPVVVSAAVPDTQSAACWVAVTPDGRYAYVANTGSSTVSSYGFGAGGKIALLEAAAGDTGSGSAPADTAVSADGRQLYVRNGRTATLSAFAINPDGGLEAQPLVGDLPATAVGLAAN